MKNWRFRTSWTGKLVLQRCVRRDGPREEWRDASSKDLLDYYNDMKAST